VIAVSQCAQLNVILIDRLLLIRFWRRMELNFLEQGLVMLKVASTGMETQDAHEDILVIGQIGHCLDILDVRMLHQNKVYTSS
jgi:hypothetical protein